MERIRRKSTPVFRCTSEGKMFVITDGVLIPKHESKEYIKSPKAIITNEKNVQNNTRKAQQ